MKKINYMRPKKKNKINNENSTKSVRKKLEKINFCYEKFRKKFLKRINIF